MKSLLIKSLTATVFAFGVAATASAGVNVKYVESDKFSDLPFGPIEREQALTELSAHFAKLGEKLPAGQDLEIEVTDIDMAGREYPSMRSGRELRVLKGTADWPMMTLRYSLSENGQVIKAADAKLSDMGYLQRASRLNDSDTLRFEKRMIDEWFAKTFLGK